MTTWIDSLDPTFQDPSPSATIESFFPAHRTPLLCAEMPPIASGGWARFFSLCSSSTCQKAFPFPFLLLCVLVAGEFKC